MVIVFVPALAVMDYIRTRVIVKVSLSDAAVIEVPFATTLPNAFLVNLCSICDILIMCELR